MLQMRCTMLEQHSLQLQIHYLIPPTQSHKTFPSPVSLYESCVNMNSNHWSHTLCWTVWTLTPLSHDDVVLRCWDCEDHPLSNNNLTPPDPCFLLSNIGVRGGNSWSHNSVISDWVLWWRKAETRVRGDEILTALFITRYTLSCWCCCVWSL